MHECSYMTVCFLCCTKDIMKARIRRYYEQLIPYRRHSTYGLTNRGSSKQCDAVRTCLRVTRVPPHEARKVRPCNVPTAASHGQLPTCEACRSIILILTNILQTDVHISFFWHVDYTYVFLLLMLYRTYCIAYCVYSLKTSLLTISYFIGIPCSVSNI